MSEPDGLQIEHTKQERVCQYFIYKNLLLEIYRVSKSVNIFSFGHTAFLSAERLESIILRKITSELHFPPPQKIWNEELTAANYVFLHII